MKVGDPAEIRIDEFPDKVMRGKVQEIAPASGSQFALLPPDNATGNYTKVVQRIPVKIVLGDPTQAAQLRPGLSVTATVKTSHKQKREKCQRKPQFCPGLQNRKSPKRSPQACHLNFRKARWWESWAWSWARVSSP